MKKTCTPFDTRQEMQTTDFEIFHSFNNKPIIVDYHHHDFCEILIFISGNVSYIVEGKTYYLRPGDIMMTNNKEIHRPVVNEGQSYERYVVWVHQNFFDRFLKSQNHPIDLSLCFDSSSKRHYNLLRPSPELLKKLTQLLESLIISPDDDGFGADILREIHMCEFLILLNRAYFLTGPLEVDVDVVYDD
ncbi:MAG: AraC family ligand binding domain-containing protein, partial [Eubacterium sp.]